MLPRLWDHQTVWDHWRECQLVAPVWYGLVTSLFWNTSGSGYSQLYTLSSSPDTSHPHMTVHRHYRQTCFRVAAAPGVDRAPRWKLTQFSPAGDGTHPVRGAPNGTPRRSQNSRMRTDTKRRHHPTNLTVATPWTVNTK